MVIYVTGKSGSGKSEFSKQLAKKLNYNYINVDKISHKIYNNPTILKKIYELFGTDINDANGKLNRKKLGYIIFSEPNSERVKLFNNLTLHYIQNLLDKIISNNSVVDWFFIPQTKYWQRNSLKILIKSQNDHIRINQLIQRDNVSEEYIKLRDKQSINYNENDFDFIFFNNYENNSIKENILTVFNFINSATRLTILGTQSPYAKENNACPSFLISNNKTQLLLDCGSGSHRFFNINNMNNLTIAISHLHREHYNDLYNYMYTSFVMKNLSKQTNPIKIYLPTEPFNIYQDIKNEKLTFSNIIDIEENKIYNFDNLKIQFLKTQHSNDVLSYATKVTINNKTIIYTGDCSYASKQDIIKFANNANILICESSFLTSYGFQTECNHLTALQAAEIAKEANVDKLILTHFWPEENVENYYNEAKQIFNKVFIAKEKDSYLV